MISIRLLPCVLAAALAAPLAIAEDGVPPEATPAMTSAAAGDPDQVTAQAAAMMATGNHAGAIAVLAPYVQGNPQDVLARQTLLAARVAALEAEIRGLLAEQADHKGLIAGSPDYEEAKARADKAVVKRLDIVEYLLAQGRLPEAANACNAILRDHPQEPATTCLKFRILNQMVERERKELLKEKEYRHGEGINDVMREGIFPRQKPKIARTVWTFDEDIADEERAAVRAKLQERVDLLYGPSDGTQSVKLAEVLPVLFKIAGINYVILDSSLSEETLTVHLVNATVEDALSTIAKLVKVKYNYAGSTVFVGGEDTDVLTSDIIRLQAGLTDIMEEPQLPTLGEGSGGGGGGGGRGRGGFGGNAAGNAPPPPAPAAGAGGEKKSDLERFLAEVGNIIVGWPTDGKIFLEKKSNTIYVRSTPWTIAELRRLLAAMDYNSVQVHLQTRFLEVTDSAGRDLGFSWEGGYQDSTTTVSSNPGLIPPVLGGTPTAATPATIGANGLAAQVLFNNGSIALNAKISALEKAGKADTLSEPEILTLNNATGIISLVRDVVYVSRYDVQYVSNAPTVTPGNGTVITNNTSALIPEYEEEQQGISLKFKPSVARNSDVITIKVEPIVKELLELRRQPFNDPNANSITNEPVFTEKPIFGTRSLSTIFHIQNGQTIALGGLISERDQTDTQGVPGISRVPVLGWLFKKQNKSSERRHLVILVTAHLVDPSGAKIGEEIRNLRATARVVLSPEARERLDADREADAKAAVDRARDGAPAERPTVRDTVPPKGGRR